MKSCLTEAIVEPTFSERPTRLTAKWAFLRTVVDATVLAQHQPRSWQDWLTQHYHNTKDHERHSRRNSWGRRCLPAIKADTALGALSRRYQNRLATPRGFCPESRMLTDADNARQYQQALEQAGCPKAQELVLPKQAGFTVR